MNKEKTSDNYIPFGEEWEEEVNKMSKKILITWLRQLCIEKQELQKEVNWLRENNDAQWEIDEVVSIYGRKWKIESIFHYKETVGAVSFDEETQDIIRDEFHFCHLEKILIPNLDKSTENLSEIKDKDEWLKEIRGED